MGICPSHQDFCLLHRLDPKYYLCVLHVLNNPYEVIKEIKRVLSPGGVFLLHDWIRAPLPDYLERMAPDTEDDQKEIIYGGLMGLFTAHNKYTVEDWLWLLKEAGLKVVKHQQLGSPHFCTFACEKSM